MAQLVGLIVSADEAFTRWPAPSPGAIPVGIIDDWLARTTCRWIW
jgi:hypothetical protein